MVEVVLLRKEPFSRNKSNINICPLDGDRVARSGGVRFSPGGLQTQPGFCPPRHKTLEDGGIQVYALSAW